MEEVINYLNKKATEVPDFLQVYFRITSPGIDTNQLDKLEKHFGYLPKTFAHFIKKYNISTLNLKMLKLNLGMSQNLTDYVENLINDSEQVNHPFKKIITDANSIIIGSFEQDNLILNIATGEVSLFFLDEQKIYPLTKSIEQLITSFVSCMKISDSSKASRENSPDQSQKLYIDFVTSEGLHWNKAWELLTNSL